MTDIEFILSSRPNLRKSVLYLHDTGVFRPEVYVKLQQIWRDVKKIDTASFVQATRTTSLFGERQFYIEIRKKDELQTIYPLLDKLPPEDKVFVSTPKELEADSKHIKQEITEVSKNKAGFKACTQWLLQKLQIPDAFLEKNTLLLQNIEELFSKCNDIAEFLLRAEYILICCSVNNTWDSTLFRVLLPQTERKEYYKLQENIYFLLTTPSEGAKEQFYMYIEDLFTSGATSRRIVSYLYTAVFDLCEINAHVGEITENNNFKMKSLSRFQYIQIERLLKFITKLCEHEGNLNTGNFLLQTEEMLQDILNIL